MAFAALGFASLLLLSLLISLLLLSTRNDKRKLPPGPAKLPFIGNLHQLGDIPHRSLHLLSRKHGPLMYLKLGTVPTVVASSADTARELLKDRDLDCCSRPQLTSFHKFSYGCNDIACIPYGEQWRQLRKTCIVLFFSAKKVASFRSIREEEVERMMETISGASAVNLSEELLALSNNITCRSSLGRRYYSGRKLHGILRETEAMLNGFFFADYMPMLGWLDVITGMRGRLERNSRELDDFFQQVVDERRMGGRDVGGEQRDVVGQLLDLQKRGADQLMTDQHVKGVLTV